MKPSVQILGIHLPGKKIILTAGPADAVEKGNIPNPIEKCLGRLTDSSFDQLTYHGCHFRYSIVDYPTSPDAHSDVCNPVRFPNLRKEPMLCIMNSVQPKNHDLFA
jgi:hypothetical protein